MVSEEIRGLPNPPAIREWLSENVDAFEGELDFELVAAGGSNLTYVVCDASAHRVALRRPPVAARIATAHDMSREWRIIAALHAHPEAGVPVPAAIAYCDDHGIMGSDFYAMGFADGKILRGPDDAVDMTAAQCRVASESLIDVQVAMHRIDVDAVGLGDLGRREGYVERQLKRWLRQFEMSTQRELPVVYELHEKLSKHVPVQQGVGLCHGDYRFDNTVMGADFRVQAVLDWELCTLGDPVADFVWSLLYWSDPDDAGDFGSPSPTRHVAFPRRAEASVLYGERSGFDLENADYYIAFSWWKMACLVEGVTARLQAGAGGGASSGGDLESVLARIDGMLDNALDAARKF
jgi:aminoglycoside phosphotransferase (APT) family kinase protein